MKIGAIYPQIELDGDPEAFRRFGVAIEDLGYDYLLMYDHVVGAIHRDRNPPLAGPYHEGDPFHDPMVAFAHMAGLTKRIELHTGILILPQRQTVLLARQAADLALMSNDRLRLGVGTGWNYVEYEALGEDFHTRGRKLDEQIPYLRRLWSEGPFSFDGEFHRLDRGNILPRPHKPIPIYVGGFSEPAYRRAAKMGDGFIFAVTSPDMTAGWDRVQALLREEGRTTDRFAVQFFLTPNRVYDYTLPQTIEAALKLRDLGATEISISTMGRGFKGVDRHLDFLTEAHGALTTALR